MEDANQATGSSAPEILSVDAFRPEDAEGIVELFHAVYGDGYPIRLFYDPEAIIAANEEGRYISVVARGPSGMVVGVNHLFPSAPYGCLFEAGVGMVLKEYRGGGANRRMLGFLYEDYVPRHPHIEEIFGEAVCYHLHMQRAVLAYKHVETAIQVALMPTEAYSKERDSSGRVATLDVFRCYRPKPHTVFLPAVYEEPLRWVYSRLDDARSLEVSRSPVPPGAASRLDVTLFEYAAVARMNAHATGEDFADRLAEMEAQALAAKTLVLQMRLDLTEPWVGAAVDVLRSKGYFFGGPLPRWFDGDGLLMQKLVCPPDFDAILPASDAGSRLLEIIKEDRRSVGADGQPHTGPR